MAVILRPEYQMDRAWNETRGKREEEYNSIAERKGNPFLRMCRIIGRAGYGETRRRRRRKIDGRKNPPLLPLLATLFCLFYFVAFGVYIYM
jgi:hypothetical protein